MARAIENEIAGLIEQSNDIAQHVRLENWESVGQLTEQRQSALEQFFNAPIKKEYLSSVEQMIRQIMKIDHGLVAFIEQEKKKTFNRFANLKNNNKANKTYQNVASLNFG